MAGSWNPGLYESAHSFVWQYGEELLALLAPQPGERILDAGCGTGQLTARIAETGAAVIGVDNSAEMIAQARRNYPGLTFELRDLCGLSWQAEFDAVFSNAALHWVRAADEAAGGFARALKPGGRFVAEFGGKGNVAQILNATWRALEALGIDSPERLNPWYYPSEEEYSAVLQSAGLTVLRIESFDRPTKLEGGIAAWMEMFGSRFLGAVDAGQKEALLSLVQQHAAPALLREGTWYADYRRLRVVARKPTG